MYRKQADRLIVRGSGRLLRDMRRDGERANRRWALIACQAAHPDWFRHHDLASVELLLRDAGIDMSD